MIIEVEEEMCSEEAQILLIISQATLNMNTCGCIVHLIICQPNNNSPRSNSLNRNYCIENKLEYMQRAKHRFNQQAVFSNEKYASPQRVNQAYPPCINYSTKPNFVNERMIVNYNCAPPIMYNQPNVQYIAAYPPPVMNTIVYTNLSPQMNNFMIG